MSRRALAGITARGMYRVQGVQGSARGVSIPAPVLGWDAISPLAAMDPKAAIQLDNIFPQPGYVEIRKGHKTWNHLHVSSPVETVMAYHAANSTNDKLFAAAGTAIYDVTTFTTATTSAASLGSMTNARYQFMNVGTSGGQFLWICNGADAPRTFDGSVWTTASVTGVTMTSIINCNQHKNRIWLVLANSLNSAYLNTDSIQGTASPFNLVGVFKKGGALQAIGTWTVDAGDGPDDYLAFVTDRGEVAVYGGTDPATNFTIKGVYQMGAPIGRRCLTKVGADLAVISIDGVVPLSQALVTDRAAAVTVAITKAIQPVMNASARAYGAHFGWQLIGYPKGTRAILNVPINENTEQQQYIMNTVTGAWCRFTGENANCWEVFRDGLYYGTNDGKVKLADCQGFDDDGSIEFAARTAFNYCDSQGRLKQYTMCRAVLTTDGQVSPGLAVNVDFSNDATVDVISTQQSSSDQWNVALWDGGTWPEVNQITTDWISVAGMGYSASITMEGLVVAGMNTDESQPVTFQINGWDMLVIDGAFI